MKKFIFLLVALHFSLLNAQEEGIGETPVKSIKSIKTTEYTENRRNSVITNQLLKILCQHQVLQLEILQK